MTMKKMLLAGAAVFALSAFAASAANAMEFEVNTGITSVSQDAQNAVVQANQAVTSTNGEVRDNSSSKSLSLAGLNMADIDQEVNNSGADASLDLSLSGSASASAYNNGYEAASGAASGATGAGLFTPASNYASNYASADGWQTGEAAAGAFSANFHLDLPSAETDQSVVGVNQVIRGPLLQTNYAAEASGQVEQASTVGSSAIALGDSATVRVRVGGH
jgi:hypothetical protein